MNDASSNQTCGSGARVVHSSPGRLRVHWPGRPGALLEQLREQPGVRSVEASAWTDNVLVLYDGRRTSEAALLSMMGLPVPEVRLEALRLVAEGERPIAEGEKPPGYVVGRMAQLYKALGWGSVGMAVVGAIMPGIPTAPFVILAGYFFIRSSPRAHAWLRRSSWFGPILRDWEEERAIRPSLKYGAVGLMVGGLALTIALGLPLAVIGSVLAIDLLGMVIVLRLPTAEGRRKGLPAIAEGAA